MKVVVLNDNELSIIAVDDSHGVHRYDTHTVLVDDEGTTLFQTLLCNKHNSTLYKDVQLPTGWAPGKYLFDGVDWTVNSSYIEPVTSSIDPSSIIEFVPPEV